MDKFDLIEYLPNIKIVILDHYCYNGSLSYYLAKHNPNWTVVGYDTEENLARTLPYYIEHYPQQLEPRNLRFVYDEYILNYFYDYVLYTQDRPNIKSNNFIKI